MLTEEENIHSATGTLPKQGLTYKVVIEVDGVKTRALIDHGAHISIVRQKLLPIIREKHGWTMEKYQQQNLQLDRQPVGASGEALGVMAVVVLKLALPDDITSSKTTSQQATEHDNVCEAILEQAEFWHDAMDEENFDEIRGVPNSSLNDLDEAMICDIQPMVSRLVEKAPQFIGKSICSTKCWWFCAYD